MGGCLQSGYVSSSIPRSSSHLANECASSQAQEFIGWVLAFRESFLLSQYRIRDFCLVVLMYLTVTAAFFTIAWSTTKTAYSTLLHQLHILFHSLQVLTSNHATAYIHTHAVLKFPLPNNLVHYLECSLTPVFRTECRISRWKVVRTALIFCRV